MTTSVPPRTFFSCPLNVSIQNKDCSVFLQPVSQKSQTLTPIQSETILNLKRQVWLCWILTCWIWCLRSSVPCSSSRTNLNSFPVSGNKQTNKQINNRHISRHCSSNHRWWVRILSLYSSADNPHRPLEAFLFNFTCSGCEDHWLSEKRT